MAMNWKVGKKVGKVKDTFRRSSGKKSHGKESLKKN